MHQCFSINLESFYSLFLQIYIFLLFHSLLLELPLHTCMLYMHGVTFFYGSSRIFIHSLPLFFILHKLYQSVIKFFMFDNFSIGSKWLLNPSNEFFILAIAFSTPVLSFGYFFMETISLSLLIFSI